MNPIKRKLLARFVLIIWMLLFSACSVFNTPADDKDTQTDSTTSVGTDSATSVGTDSATVVGTDSATSGGTDFDSSTAVSQCNGCLINDICVPNGFVPAQNPCLICLAEVGNTAWSNNDGASCDDELFCTTGDICSGGSCVANGAVQCADDGLFCNGTESCNEEIDACASSGSPCLGANDQCFEEGNVCCAPGELFAETLRCTVDGDALGYDSCGSIVLSEDCVAEELNGTCVNGVCGCKEGYAGALCDTCAQGRYGSDCERCMIMVNNDLSIGATRDGLTWETALQYVQEGINKAAETGCDVWVAKGTYTPRRDAAGSMSLADERTKTFALKSGVVMYGGFAGTENDPSERGIEENETVLSGDVGVAEDNTDNTYNVVTAHDQSTINGFTITGGNANGEMVVVQDSCYRCCTVEPSTTSDKSGGGMYVPGMGSRVTVSHCRFTDNHAEIVGGGMYGEGLVENSTFERNSAGSGGGLFIPAVQPEKEYSIVRQSAFNNNVATGSGGGVGTGWLSCDWGFGYSYEPSLSIIEDCVFDGNIANYGGGAKGPTVVEQSLFVNNSAESGGAVTNTNVTLNSTFRNNSAVKGGAIYNGTSLASPSIIGGTFVGNTAEYGGAIYANLVQAGRSSVRGTVALSNSIFVSNHASSSGGAAYFKPNEYSDSLNGFRTVRNCTFFANDAQESGGAIFAPNSIDAIVNSIFWNNSAPIAPQLSDVEPERFENSVIQNNNIEGGCDAFVNATCHDSNIDVDPLFVDPANGNLRLQSSSPCINAGENSLLPTYLNDLVSDHIANERIPYDVAGNPRIADDDLVPPDTVDMGAYEFWSGCGNYNIEAGEGCDDGNQFDGDGCSVTCQIG